MDNRQTIIEKIIIERNKAVDSAVIMEIKQIAVENGIETKFILNEKNIINALEKQIPKKPEKTSEDYENGHRVTEWECPSCKNPYIDDCFCSRCGQALDWSGTA